MFNATFNNISVISWWSVLLVEETGVVRENRLRLLVEETAVPRENHLPVASHWQTSFSIYNFNIFYLEIDINRVREFPININPLCHRERGHESSSRSYVLYPVHNLRAIPSGLFLKYQEVICKFYGNDRKKSNGQVWTIQRLWQHWAQDT